MAAAFPSPRFKLAFEKSSFSASKGRHMRHINEHYFNFAVDVCLPGVSKLPADLASVLVEQQAYLVKGLPLSALIDKQFIEAFIKRGAVYMLSHGTRIDVDNCVALLPTGCLILHLNKDTYEELGLDGKPSQVNFKRKKKYVVSVPLTAPYFRPGKKFYERVKWCLDKRLDLVFDMMVAWVPTDVKVCSSSMQKFFSSIHGYDCRPIEVRQRLQRQRRMLQVPVIKSTESDATDHSCGYNDLFEWLGMQACNIACSSEVDSFTNTLCCPEPSELVDSCVNCQWSGFLTPDSIQALLEKLRVHVEDSGAPWSAMTVHGYGDSPTSWSDTEHGHHQSGDNLCTYVFFPGGSYWLYTATGTHDVVS